MSKKELKSFGEGIGPADPGPGDIVFHAGDGEEPILKLCSNGDIYVKGRLAENDKEVVQGMRELLEMKRRELWAR